MQTITIPALVGSSANRTIHEMPISKDDHSEMIRYYRPMIVELEPMDCEEGDIIRFNLIGKRAGLLQRRIEKIISVDPLIVELV